MKLQMFLRGFAPVGFVITTIAGCGAPPAANPKPAAQPTSVKEPIQQTLTTPHTGAVGGASLQAAAAQGAVAPTDARYTIVCTRFGGSGHVQEAKRIKDTLVSATGRREFYLVHEDLQSTLYFGYYKQIARSIDPVEAARADKDLTFIRSLENATHARLFPGALKEALAVADPDGPAEYDLTRIDSNKSPNDPTRRFWSVAIAAYTVDAVGRDEDRGKNRKQLALEVVIEARKQGVEAYYYHGPNVSTVCIGAWPRTAVKEQETNEVASLKGADPSQELVVSAGPLPAGMREQFANSGHDVKVFEPKIEIQDPTLLAAMNKYNHYNVNGRPETSRVNDPKTGKPTIKYQPTFLVQIPELQPSLLRAEVQPNNSEPSPAGALAPLTPSSSGGRLRSVGQ